MNRVILIGNLGSDAELKYTQGGQAVSTFRVCTTEKWTDKSGAKQEKSEWHTCVWWGKGAEAVSRYMEKGKKVAVEGSLQTRSWEDKAGGKRYATEVKVQNMELLSSNSGGQRQGRTDDGHSYDKDTGEVNTQSSGGAPYGDDDIPFAPRNDIGW